MRRLPLILSPMHRLFLLLAFPGSLWAGPQASQLETDPEELPETSSLLSGLFDGIHRIDTNFDALLSDDIDVWSTSLSYSQERLDSRIEFQLSYTDYSIDYTDPVGITQASRRDESTWNGTLSLSQSIRENLELTLSASAYDGFSDFQSLWISEYYDQAIGIPFPAGYEDADPHGWGVSLGSTLDLEDGRSRLTANLTFGRDQIIPAWSPGLNPVTFTPEAQRTRDNLDSWAGSLTWERALNPRLRTYLTARVSDVTARDPRLQLQNRWSWSVTDQVTLRAEIGGAIENPDFEAIYAALTVDYEFLPSWHLGASARHYADNGEVVAAGFNTAAPGLDAQELSAYLRWSGESLSVLLSGGVYLTEYDALSPANQFFANLYQDRDYVLGRLAITYNF